MNLLLLEPEELRADGTAVLEGRRLAHVREVLRLAPGDTLRAGVVGGACGTAVVEALSADALVLRPTLTEAPPPRPGIDLLLALPRPKALKRLLPGLAQLGVDTLVLVNAARVEKSYFSSPALEADTCARLLREGLEQARDTVLPRVLVRERFRPFVEDELGALFPASTRLVAHPDATAPLPQRSERRVLLAIGPEGGWVPFELDLLAAHGFAAVSAGPRILRTEVAVPALLGALSLRG